MFPKYISASSSEWLSGRYIEHMNSYLMEVHSCGMFHNSIAMATEMQTWIKFLPV
jgi:hypothetical protein